MILERKRYGEKKKSFDLDGYAADKVQRPAVQMVHIILNGNPLMMITGQSVRAFLL